MRWIIRGIVAGLFLCGLLLLAPFVLKSAPAAPRTEALSDIKQISTMLFEFDSEYGTFPSADTIDSVKDETKTTLTLGSSSSNQLFRQLLVSTSGIKSERPFWVKTGFFNRRPDDIFNTDTTALAKGECVFAYVAGLNSSGDPQTPVVMTPLISGKQEFDPGPFKGYAVILRLDNSAVPYPIDKNGHVILSNGMDIFDPRQPFWHGKAPDVKWPE